MVLLILFAQALLAQDAGARPDLPPVPKYEVKWRAGPLAIDGTAQDPAWKGANVAELIFPWDFQTGPKQQTRVRLLWDDSYLYIAYECADADIVALHGHRDDPTYRDDAVEFFVNPKPSQRDFYYGLEMNARAVLYDYFYAFPKLLLKRFDMSGIQIATYMKGTLNVRNDTDEGWSLELAIPWSNFQELAPAIPPVPGTVWAANLNRWDGTEPNRRLSLWSDSGASKPSPHVPSRFGELVFVK